MAVDADATLPKLDDVNSHVGQSENSPASQCLRRARAATPGVHGALLPLRDGKRDHAIERRLPHLVSVARQPRKEGIERVIRLNHIATRKLIGSEPVEQLAQSRPSLLR